MADTADLVAEVAHLRFRVDLLVGQIEVETGKSRECCRKYKRLRRQAREQMIGARACQLRALAVARRVAVLRAELLRLTKRIDYFGAEQDMEIRVELRAVGAMIDAYAG